MSGESPVVQNVLEKVVGAFKTHEEALELIFLRGDIAVFVYEPGKVAYGVARQMGWDGSSPCFALPSAFEPGLASAHHATKRWVARRPAAGEAVRGGRMFLLMHRGAWLINYVFGEGFSLEPAPRTPTSSTK